MNMRRHHPRGPGGLIVLALIVAGTYLWAREQPGQVVVFAGSNRHVVEEFSGTDATTVFGGYKLDLRDASMRGHSAAVNVNTVFGGAQITVPEDWNVVYEGRAIFGGFEDKTRHPARDDSRKDLIVDGLTMFGGLQVRN